MVRKIRKPERKQETGIVRLEGICQHKNTEHNNRVHH